MQIEAVRLDQRHTLPRIILIWLMGLVCLFCALAEDLIWPVASGDQVAAASGTTIDCSHADQGYIMVKQSAGKKRYKVRIQKGDETYTYDLNNNGEFEVYPLQLGEGSYTVKVYKQQSGSQYSAVSTQKVKVDAFAREYAAFLVPSQYVNYTASTAAVVQSQTLCASLDNDQAKVDALSAWILRNVNYDYILALTVEKNYMPVLDDVMNRGMGICFDYASLFACMLRVQGIPAQLVIGYADDGYHAWNNVYLDNQWVRYDLTAQASGMKVLAYTTERYY